MNALNLTPKSAVTLKRTLRVSRHDSAYLYFILESHEGLTAYTTLRHTEGDRHRDVELIYTDDFRQDVDDLTVQLALEIPVVIVA